MTQTSDRARVEQRHVGKTFAELAEWEAANNQSALASFERETPGFAAGVEAVVAWLRTPSGKGSEDGVDYADGFADQIEATAIRNLTPAPPASEQIAENANCSDAEGLDTDALVEKVADAIEAASCPNREGPFGGYDYGHNEAFYGPAPEGGRYVIRDFRDRQSKDWGAFLHLTNDREEHEAMFAKMTREHIARAALSSIRPTLDAERAKWEGEVADWLRGKREYGEDEWASGWNAATEMLSVSVRSRAYRSETNAE